MYYADASGQESFELSDIDPMSDGTLVMGLCTLDGDLSSAQHGAMYRHKCCKMPYCSVKRRQNSHPTHDSRGRPARRSETARSSSRVEVEVRRYGRPVEHVSVSNPKTTPPLRRNVDRRNDPQNPTDLGRISDETA